ncbi:hypothetical protein FRC02_001764 [Tulasnella sp. 418]|nr:hypothetical protein FRC02_001764 [Tulasnella sp. 418]
MKILRATFIENKNNWRQDAPCYTGIWEIPGDVSKDEWDRFIFAFNHVKQLQEALLWEYQDVQTTLKQLHRTYGGELKPGFREISGCTGLKFDWSPFLVALFHDNLKSIKIIPELELHAFLEVEVDLETLLKGSPRLQDITVRSCSRTFQSMESFSELTLLRMVGGVSIPTLLSAFRCPNLKWLTLLPTHILPTQDPLSLEHSMIVNSSIKRLTFSLPDLQTDLDSISNELENIRLPNLRNLSVVLDGGEWSRIHPWMERISKGSPDVVQVQINTTNAKSPTSFFNLQGFRKIKILEITEITWSRVIERMNLKAWLLARPLLEDFKWTPCFGDAGNIHLLKFHFLFTFAFYSPNLKELSLSLHMSDLLGQMERWFEEHAEISMDRNTPFPSLRYLKLVVHDLRESELKIFIVSLVKLVPENVRVEICLRPIKSHFPLEEDLRTFAWNRAVEPQIPTLISKYRSEIKAHADREGSMEDKQHEHVDSVH